MSDEVEVLDKDLVVVQQGILKAAEITLAGITEMVNSAVLLEIKGIDDKAGYRAVHDKKMEFVHTRGKLEKAAKKGREAAIKYQRDNIKIEKSLIGLMKPTEDELAAKEKVVDDALEEIRLEKVRQEEARIQKRVDRLEVDFGMRLFAQKYSLPFDAPGTDFPAVLVKSCTDEQYEKFCAAIQEAITAEQTKIAAEQQKKKEDEERLAQVAAEQEAERLRLAEIEQKQAAAYEQIRIQAELQRKQEEALEAEKKRIADTEAARIKAIEDEKLRVYNEAKRQAELEQARKEAAEKALKDAGEKAKREAQEKAAQEEKERIAADRKAARAPDKDKLLGYAIMLENVLPPIMKTEDGKAVLDKAVCSIAETIEHLREKAGAL